MGGGGPYPLNLGGHVKEKLLFLFIKVIINKNTKDFCPSKSGNTF
jgi:hypothetical protein